MAIERFTTNERGSILISLLLVMSLSVLAFSSMIVGTVEYALANNSVRQAQALALAESGVEHAMMEIIDADGDLVSFLAGSDDTPGTDDDGLLLGSAPIAIGDAGGTYWVVLEDNDDGDGDTSIDSDGQYHLLSTGVISGVTQTVRLVLDDGTGGGWTPPHGVLTEDDLTIDSGVELVGANSSAFSNDDVVINNYRLDGGAWSADNFDIYSSNPEIEGDILDSDGVDDYEKAHDNQDKEDIPDIVPGDFAAKADYTLGSDGKVYLPNGTVVHNANDGAWGNWTYDGGGDWTLDGPTSSDVASFYVDGSVTVSGTGGTVGAPLELSLFTEGSVAFAGDFYLAARYQGVLALTGGDVFVNGDTDFDGSFVVREQLKMQGGSTLRGVIVVADADDDFDLLDRTSEGTHLTDTTTIWPDTGISLPITTGVVELKALEWREEH